MNSVEAAASLFGPEESGTDLFATIGTDTASSQTSDDLFSSVPLISPEEPTPHPESYLTDYPPFEDYPHLSDELKSNLESSEGKSDEWSVSNLESTYSTPSNVSLPTNLNDYAPSACRGPVPYQYNSSNYRATSSSYVTESSIVPSSHQSYDSSTAPAYNGLASTTPLPQQTKPSIIRPKVSNAYDPPFMPTLPLRRPGRMIGNEQQTFDLQTQQIASSTGGQIFHQQQPLSLLNAHGESQVNANLKQTEDIQIGISPSKYLCSSLTMIDNVSGRDNTNSPELVAKAASSRNNISASADGDNHFYNSNNQNSIAHGPPINSSSFLPPSSADNPTGLPSRNSSQASLSHSSASTALPYTRPYPHDVQNYGRVSQANIDKPSSNLGNIQSQMSRSEHDPYAPKVNHNNYYVPRTSSPLSFTSHSNETRQPSANPQYESNGYLPRPLASTAESGLKEISFTTSDSRHLPQNLHLSEDRLFSNEIIVASAALQYAPSPSLVGANDPLSRPSARAPVVTFGFGGKIVTCFHGMPGLNAGFDVALSSKTSSEVKVHTIQKLLPEVLSNSDGNSFPGPLLADPGASSLSLVRPGFTAQTKAKKAAILNYLSGRADEIHQGLGYLTGSEKQTAENRLILVKLLAIMIENDGRLSGTPQIDSAVRSTLVASLDSSPISQDVASHQGTFKDFDFSFDETPFSVVTVKSSALDKIENLLVKGDRRQAYQFAIDQKLWAHAMIIASSIDKESWKEVVNDFLRLEVGGNEIAVNGKSLNPRKTRVGLRVAYSLFSGQGASAVQEFAPVNLIHRTTGRFQPMTTPNTPRTPNFLTAQIPIPAESLVNWAETVAMMICSPLTPETAGALTVLGDQLQANNWCEAAHACYLLASQTSLLGGFGNSTARITLVGAKNPADALKDPDALIFSEILEFALSLVPTIKGQEPYHGLPHLQAYRFIRAVLLAENGDIQIANRYCEAIAVSINHSSPYITFSLLEQLQSLQQRLSGVFHADKSASWIGGKLSKPSLDTIGGWLEGRFTKLVTGESDSPTPTVDLVMSSDQPFAGPFAHYSTISSNTPSARSSPQPPSANFIPPRTASAMSTSSRYSLAQIERSSSAIGRQQPALPTLRDNRNGSLSLSQSSPTGDELNDRLQSEDSFKSLAEETEITAQATSWWSSFDENNESTATPTATTFMKVDETSVPLNKDGLLSLMDNHAFSVGADLSENNRTSSSLQTEDKNDLGLGNFKPKPTSEKQDDTGLVKGQSATQATPKVSTPANVPASGSWFGRWWRGSESSSGPAVKASLGEESAFYYDNEQKRWINKKASNESPKQVAPPPPPSRAQTASPGMTGSVSKSAHLSGPPVRSASAMDLSSETPNLGPMRIRSNLAPPTESALGSPTGKRTSPDPPLPPPGRPKSQAAKRNIRSRYVDVFQQEGTAGA